MFIGEIGINHNGDIRIAKLLIQMAKKCGVDVVKFQKRNVDICIPEHMKKTIKKTPWGKITYYEYKKRIEFSKKEYDIIDSYCKDNDIKWTASVWDLDSLDFICSYNIPFIKIPSACITNKELLLETKKKNIPVIISTGMSTLDEIQCAVNLLKGCDLTIMHCNSSYPAADNELDLLVIHTLKEMFPDCRIGYSGHEENIHACIIANLLGADVIEKHITLNKDLWGSDHKSSLDEEELSTLIKVLKSIPLWLGQQDIKIYDSELKSRQKLRK